MEFQIKLALNLQNELFILIALKEHRIVLLDKYENDNLSYV